MIPFSLFRSAYRIFQRWYDSRWKRGCYSIHVRCFGWTNEAYETDETNEVYETNETDEGHETDEAHSTNENSRLVIIQSRGYFRILNTSLAKAVFAYGTGCSKAALLLEALDITGGCMSDSGPSISRIITSSTGFVEKAVEFRHFMLFTSFILLLDSCLLMFFGKNILSSFKSLNEPEVNAASAIIFLGVFFFCMALFFPALRQITRLGIAWIYFKWFFNPSKKSELNNSWHYPSLIKHEALKNKDKVILEIIEKHEEETKNKNINLNVGFSLVILFAINYFVLGGEHLSSITQQAELLLDRDFGFWINRIINAGLAVFVIFNFVMAGLSLNPIEEDKVYIPFSSDDNNVQ